MSSGPLAGRERRAESRHVIRAQPELRQQRARLEPACGNAPREDVEQRLLRVVGSALLADHAGKDATPELSRPRRELELAEKGAEQRRLSRPVGARDGDALPCENLDVERAQPKGLPLDDGTGKSEHGRSDTPFRTELEPQLPRLEWLLGQRVSLEQPLRLADLRPQRIRAASIGTAGPLAQPGSVSPSLGLAPGHQARQLAAALLGIRELRVRRGACLVAAPRVVRPAARPLHDAVGARIDLGDPTHRCVEKGTVVRDDHGRARESDHEARQAGKPVGIEVVRRLVEQEEVGLREQDRGERRPCSLAAREPGERAIELDPEPELGAQPRRTCLEVASAQRQEPTQRAVVAL